MHVIDGPLDKHNQQSRLDGVGLPREAQSTRHKDSLDESAHPTRARPQRQSLAASAVGGDDHRRKSEEQGRASREDNRRRLPAEHWPSDPMKSGHRPTCQLSRPLSSSSPAPFAPDPSEHFWPFWQSQCRPDTVSWLPLVRSHRQNGFRQELRARVRNACEATCRQSDVTAVIKGAGTAPEKFRKDGSHEARGD